jgi:hypothetical protein
MVYAAGLTEPLARVDAAGRCQHCGGWIGWDEACGWLHMDGFYACRDVATGVPREVMASPREERA